jgi:hypothetical protein
MIRQPYKVLMFSYGSGVASTMFILHVKAQIPGLREMVEEKLDNRMKIPPKVYSLSVRNREESLTRTHYRPTFEAKYARDNSYIFGGVDDLGRRIYQRYSSIPGPSLGTKSINSRLLTISKHMLESTDKAGKRQSSTPKNPEPFKNFYKKTIDERLKIVET